MRVNEDPGYRAMRERAIAAERRVDSLAAVARRAADALDPSTPSLTQGQRGRLVLELRQELGR